MKTQKIILLSMLTSLISLAVVGTLLYYANQSPTLGGNFQAVSKQGPWNFKEDAKSLNLLYVGYAKCPDVCPMALSYTHDAFAKLSDQQKNNIRFLFVSVDVEHDTVESVQAYATQFDPQFIGLTGTKIQMDQIMKLFGASYIVEPNPKSYLGYSISHTDRIYFLNKKGVVIDSLTSPRGSDLILQKIKENL